MTAIGRRKELKLSQTELKRQLHYNPSTGVFTRAIQTSGVRKGSIAGYVMRNGYIMIMVNHENYLAHRLAWLYVYGVWPTDLVDHTNQIKSDNRINNLREATASQNCANNSGHKKMNGDLPKGVSRRKNGIIVAQIRHQGHTYHLGHFKDVNQAEEAYHQAALRLHKEFAT